MTKTTRSTAKARLTRNGIVYRGRKFKTLTALAKEVFGVNKIGWIRLYSPRLVG